MEAVQKGLPAASEALLNRHLDRVYSLALRLCGGVHDAEQATEDIFVSLFSSLREFGEEDVFSIWVHRAVVIYYEGIGIPDRGQAEEVQRESLLGAGLDKLDPEHRQAVVLRDLADLDYSTISQVLEIRPGAVKARLTRARVELARHIAAQSTPMDVI